MAFPVYGPACTARTARGRVYEQDFNCVIAIGGVRVAPGDYVLADSSGVVFLAKDTAEEAIRRAERIATRETLMVEALERGEKITAVVGRDYEDMLDQLD
jgi:regulator of RNase E activity RraA